MSPAGDWLDAVDRSARYPSSGQREVRRAVRALKAIGDRLVTSREGPDHIGPLADALEQLSERLRGPPTASPRRPLPDLASAERTALAAERNPHVGLHNYLAPPLRFTTREEEPGVLRAFVRYDACHEGPPGCAHGGQLAAFFDELLLSCNTITGRGGVTARLTVMYRRPVPLHIEVEGRAWVYKEEGRKRYVKGELWGPEGKVLVEAEALVLPLPSRT